MGADASAQGGPGGSRRGGQFAEEAAVEREGLGGGLKRHGGYGWMI